MSEQTQMSKDVKAANAEKPEFALTTTGVMILGADLIGDKMTALLCEAFKMLDADGVALAEMRIDNWPQDADGPVFGMAYADTHSFAINLQRCWDSAADDAMKDEEDLGFLGMLWINVLSAIGHEIDHLNIAYGDRDLYEGMRSEKEMAKDLEDAADETARNMMIEMARTLDIEPDLADLGWFGIKIMSLMTGDDTKALGWVNKLRKQLEDSIIYDGGEDKRCYTMREFIKKAHAPNAEDWEQPITAVNLEAHLETGEVETFKADPVAAPVMETVVLEAAEEAPIEMVTNAAGAFVGAGVDLENGEPDVVIADTAAQAIVDAPTGTMICPNKDCGKELQAEWNACPHCEIVVNQAGLDAVHARLAAEATEVPLPTPVAAEQAALTAAATTGVPPVLPTEPTYALVNNMDGPQMAGCMEAVWKVLYHHTFTKCGWQQNPQTGRFMFANAAAVLEGVNVQHILSQFGAENFIMEYDTLDAEGKYAAEMCQGMIRGRTTSKQGLPSYTLYLNIGGTRIKRTFIPQNPEKRNAQNAYTNSAENAAAGHMIVWVFKDEVADAAPFNEKCAATIKDNVYEIMS